MIETFFVLKFWFNFFGSDDSFLLQYVCRLLLLRSGVYFIQKSWPQISDLKILSRSVIQFFYPNKFHFLSQMTQRHYIKQIMLHQLFSISYFYWGSFEAWKHLNMSDLIQYQTGNGLGRASGPVQPIYLLVISKKLNVI